MRLQLGLLPLDNGSEIKSREKRRDLLLAKNRPLNAFFLRIEVFCTLFTSGFSISMSRVIIDTRRKQH